MERMPLINPSDEVPGLLEPINSWPRFAERAQDTARQAGDHRDQSADRPREGPVSHRVWLGLRSDQWRYVIAPSGVVRDVGPLHSRWWI
jgi:hypothetical protein